jgi:ribonuclease HII
MIIGVDEAGRGPLAGPVVAGAVLLCDGSIDGLDDSKKLTAARRATLETEIKARCHWAVAEASVAEIDAINILQATMLAMTRAVDALVAQLGGDPAEVLVDGNRLPSWRYPSRWVISGDAIHPCISAASIIAKEHRDRIMIAADRDWPVYGFAGHKGYGSAAHRSAIAEHGPCSIHRMSFAPMRQLALI